MLRHRSRFQVRRGRITPEAASVGRARPRVPGNPLVRESGGTVVRADPIHGRFCPLRARPTAMRDGRSRAGSTGRAAADEAGERVTRVAAASVAFRGCPCDDRPVLARPNGDQRAEPARSVSAVAAPSSIAASAPTAARTLTQGHGVTRSKLKPTGPAGLEWTSRSSPRTGRDGCRPDTWSVAAPAERVGFEPTVRLHAQRFSRPPRSTALAPLLAVRPV